MKDWNTYIENTKKLQARELLIRAISFVQKPYGNALDLGAGGMRDSRYLAETGFKVTAVDNNSSIIQNSVLHGITPVVSLIENFQFTDEKYTVINAAYSLPFIHPDTFSKVFSKITGSLIPNGIFVGQFFGKHDTWSKDTKMTFHDRADVLGLVAEYNIHHFEEKEYDGSTAGGTEKHWHVFDIIAQKK